MEETINLSELFEVIRKRMVLIIGGGLVGIILAAVITYFFITPQFNSSTQLLVNRAKDESQVATQWNDLQTDVQMINTYKDIIKGPVILEDVRKKLSTTSSVEQLASKIEIITQQNSQVFTIKVTDSDPYKAADIANTVAAVFQEKIGGIMSVQNVTQISSAHPNTSQISPKPMLNILIGFIVGIMGMVGVSFLLEFMDKTVRDEKFISETLGWTNLGTISEMNFDELNAKSPSSIVSRRTKTRV
ncbi:MULTISPECIES: YveK family protein [Carnobacterium]|uniref:YveK family protein n=1 Tax=Carnobacterium TaxID=2747 RepID=UPI00288C7A47|nr:MULTISPECIES: Wzz/FepE/Etk N-terminal domain-containing protein [Carnobacterium]MDT1940053.1 Wzz/FepE/Etk N-terminal domain-containing protein [Carnobacterium divergens]MDT1942491.1 Wzz/FepE/Etk N-terminal domain-containing protein [Carnobacterium divergens]MDT1948297.1 Wzz/FepE/Etk N-terminal domain-containing protein [Carnobacterium divergens]MDT1950777.1 Wzz/FepE/Etk N-terminal domain-containing protein [Carnobacterium divergens]MDT1956057.1 Wzz/FepE/Etk N-terminal domain-containing prot